MRLVTAGLSLGWPRPGSAALAAAGFVPTAGLAAVKLVAAGHGCVLAGLVADGVCLTLTGDAVR
jgi:hypothetical protein